MKTLVISLAIMLLASCNSDEVDGIKLGNTLTENQSLTENKKLVEIVQGVINQKPNYLSSLLKFECGGAAGCYDLGSIITQIISRIGEEEFLKMTENLSVSEKNHLKGFIEVGLEYGYYLDEKKENRKFEIEFPILYRNL